MSARIIEFPLKHREEVEPQEVYPLADACQAILEDMLGEGETLPPETQERLQDLRAVEENSPEASLNLAFTLLIACGVYDPENCLQTPGGN